MPAESILVRRIRAAVKKRYPKAYVRKLADRWTRGLPDLLIAVAGKALFVETKIGKATLSALQLAELKAIHVAGAEAIVALSVEDVLAKLEEMGAK